MALEPSVWHLCLVSRSGASLSGLVDIHAHLLPGIDKTGRVTSRARSRWRVRLWMLGSK